MDIVSFPKFGIELNIDRVIFSVGGFEIYWYSVLITLGIILALLFAWFNAKHFDLDRDKFLDTAIAGTIAGILGARIYYIVFSSDISFYLSNPIEIINLRNGGLAIYGGIIFGLGAGAIFCKIRKINIKATLDLAAMGFLIGQAVGRWGNFFNQEAFGANTDAPWGMLLSPSARSNQDLLINNPSLSLNSPVHPCFLYESLWCILGFALLYIVMKKFKKFDGQIVALYIGWYGLGRVFIEGLRTDSLMLTEHIKVSQFLAGLCIVASVVLLVIGFSKSRSKAKDAGEYQTLFSDIELSGDEDEPLQEGDVSDASEESDAEELEKPEE